MTKESLSPEIAAILEDAGRRTLGASVSALAIAAILVCAFGYAGFFDLRRYADAAPTILQLLNDASPPDFSRWSKWGQPLLETLSMSMAGTALGAAAAAPLGVLAAAGFTPSQFIGVATRMVLNMLRSIPGLIWGVVFVAAVGFGPLAGALALGVHSAGMLGKFFAEIIEHADPGPADALRSQGVSCLGVLRFAVLPQILPRLIDVTIYRWEHNLRAATTLGVIGAGGIGLEIVTAFHLFEYREASALILVVLLLVTAINLIGARIRGGFLGHD